MENKSISLKALIVKYEGEALPFIFLEERNIKYELWESTVYGESLLIKVDEKNKNNLKMFFELGNEIDSVNYILVKLIRK